MGDATVHGLVDHLFRRESGRMVASLVPLVGPGQLDLAEELVQEALLRALKRWPFQGIPDNPAGWLYRVARNLALDRLRHAATVRRTAGARPRLEESAKLPATAALARELTDDQLRLVFLCCHPELPRDGRVALTLKNVCGFSVSEIARAFLAEQPTVAQRLVRARRRIGTAGIPFEVPPPEDLPARLDAVLEVIYLLFNEGYHSHQGDALIRGDLCHEGVRLARHLSAHPVTATPETHALAALLCFQASRLPARVDADGDLLRLHEQDRKLWDRDLLAAGFAHLERCAGGDHETTYHLQAAIAAEHAAAPVAAETDWVAILGHYDRLFALNPSPVVALNRAVAVARVSGSAAGLVALDRLAGDRLLEGYFLWHATRGDLLSREGRHEDAADSYERALECACSEPERRFVVKRLHASRRD